MYYIDLHNDIDIIDNIDMPLMKRKVRSKRAERERIYRQQRKPEEEAAGQQQDQHWDQLRLR